MEGEISSGGESLGSSESLSSAVEAISTEAPKLSGLDRLKAAKDHVEKTGEVPGKPSSPGQRGADGKFQAPAGAVVNPATPGEVVPAPAETPYTPDFKYKAGGKELEIPEKFRALITDKASEEEVKKLFGQAATLEESKATAVELKKAIGQRDTELTGFKSGVAQLRGHAQKNDWDNFFKNLNVAPERIYQWVLDKVNYNQLPPEQKAQIDQQRNLQSQAEMAQNQVSQASHREMQLATQVKGMQLEQTLGKADVKAMADAFDARNGAGKFRDAVVEHGKAVWALSQVDLTPEQAVADFVQKYGNPSALGNPNPAAGAATQAPTTPPSANAQPPVKVIPNVAGRSSSPVKQKPRSIEDLKRLRDSAVKADNASRNPSQGYLAG